MASRPCPDGVLKGSRLQLRSYLQEEKDEFDKNLLVLLNAAGANYSRLDWVSPIPSAGFAEYRDGEFLRQLGLNQHHSEKAPRVGLGHLSERIDLQRALGQQIGQSEFGCKRDCATLTKTDQCRYNLLLRWGSRWRGAGTGGHSREVYTEFVPHGSAASPVPCGLSGFRPLFDVARQRSALWSGPRSRHPRSAIGNHGLRDGAASERAQRQNAVEEQVHRGIDTSQKMIRCDRLP